MRTIRKVKYELSKKSSMRKVTVTVGVTLFHSSPYGGRTYITILLKMLMIFAESDLVFKREICFTEELTITHIICIS